uniref:Uncharacterized protein n=1 Tax=Salmonella enterica subsp. enterica serovar Meleagridis TaxID=486999 RepID=A0A8B0SQI1_SALET|nr:hypothetical protein GNKKMDEE_00088 [Salmonella enterica subsp. enterica serovar Meleagridis]
MSSRVRTEIKLLALLAYVPTGRGRLLSAQWFQDAQGSEVHSQEVEPGGRHCLFGDLEVMQRSIEVYKKCNADPDCRDMLVDA